MVVVFLGRRPWIRPFSSGLLLEDGRIYRHSATKMPVTARRWFKSTVTDTRTRLCQSRISSVRALLAARPDRNESSSPSRLPSAWPQPRPPEQGFQALSSCFPKEHVPPCVRNLPLTDAATLASSPRNTVPSLLQAGAKTSTRSCPARSRSAAIRRKRSASKTPETDSF